jgi:hypothetical protein
MHSPKKGGDYLKGLIIAMCCALIGIQIGLNISFGIKKRVKFLDIYKPVFSLMTGTICGCIAVLSIFWPITLLISVFLAVVLSG